MFDLLTCSDAVLYCEHAEWCTTSKCAAVNIFRAHLHITVMMNYELNTSLYVHNPRISFCERALINKAVAVVYFGGSRCLDESWLFQYYDPINAI